MALGARRGDVLGMVLRQGLTPVALGLAGGAVLAVGCSRTLGGLLYGVAATDPLPYLSVCVLLLVIAAAACFVPARRAMREDPLMSLRYE